MPADADTGALADSSQNQGVLRSHQIVHDDPLPDSAIPLLAGGERAPAQ